MYFCEILKTIWFMERPDEKNEQLISYIASRIMKGEGSVTESEAISLLKEADLEKLCNAADRIRKFFCGDSFDTCSIVNARSGRCPEDCKWCAQSKYHHTGISEYREKPFEEIVALAKENAGHGVARFSLVTSGRKVTASELSAFCRSYKEIKRTTHLKTCASMGLLNREELQMLKDAGVVRYECNLETAPSFFSKLCSTHTAEEKMQTLRWAKELGFELCSGGIIGMGETAEQRLELAFALRSLGVKSVPINILTPIPGTKLEHSVRLSDAEILRTIALFRFILPDAYIRFAGGRKLMSEALQRKALRSGINASLVGGLLTTAGTDTEADYRMFRDAGYALNV